MNDLNFYLDMAVESMKEAVAFLDDSLAHIRAVKESAERVRCAIQQGHPQNVVS